MKHKCFYLVGYHGCGKTTQAYKLEAALPQFNYIGHKKGVYGRVGLDAVESVEKLVSLIKQSDRDIVIHGCIYQTEPTILRLSRLTDLHIIVMHSLPKTVEQRTINRGATDYNVKKYMMHYRFIKKLPTLKKIYPFKLSIVDNNRDIEAVHEDIKKCVLS